MIKEDRVTYLMQSLGFEVEKVCYIPEGRNHYVFDLLMKDGTEMIAKFNRRSEAAAAEKKRDTLFGGEVSSEREAELYRIVKENGGLPAPKIYYDYQSEHINCLLVEKMKGEQWGEFLQMHNYSRSSFLASLSYLGGSIARLQRLKFDSFGDIIQINKIAPGGIDNFADRFMAVMKWRIKRAAERQVFNLKEVSMLRDYFSSSFRELKPFLHKKNCRPVMVLTDLHPENFFVDDYGRPSAFFDLESCQAAHPALEMYGVKFFLFNYFGKDEFVAAEAAFYYGYRRGGGSYDPYNSNNIRLENLLAIGRLLELAESYYGVKDGLRDSWSERFKSLLWRAVEEGEVDYLATGQIYREKNGQPVTVNAFSAV